MESHISEHSHKIITYQRKSNNIQFVFILTTVGDKKNTLSAGGVTIDYYTAEIIIFTAVGNRHVGISIEGRAKQGKLYKLSIV